MKHKKRVVLVIGPAHSGTSVLTKGLETMGIALPQATSTSGQKQSLWEDPELHTFNLEILHFFGAHLRGIIPLTEEEVEILCNEGFLRRASQLLLAKFLKDQPLGIKDPRFSVLLPFWKKVFQACNLHVSFVIALRNPWSVVASQKQHVEKSFWIWISYLLSCLEHTEGEQRIMVDYDELLKDPNHQMQRVAQSLELAIHQNLLSYYCTHYVDPALRHCHTKNKETISAHFYQQLATQIYVQLLEVAKDAIDFKHLKEPFKQWKEEYLQAHALLVLAEKNHVTIQELKQTIQTLEGSIHELHKNITQQSYSMANYCREIHQREMHISALLQASS